MNPSDSHFTDYQRVLRGLRLEAKTLIEWRTPVSDPSFKFLIDRLLGCHPHAGGRLKFDNIKHVLLLDKNRVLLWHLAETLMDRDRVRSKQDPERFAFYLNRASEEIIDFARKVSRMIDDGATDIATRVAYAFVSSRSRDRVAALWHVLRISAKIEDQGNRNFSYGSLNNFWIKALTLFFKSDGLIAMLIIALLGSAALYSFIQGLMIVILSFMHPEVDDIIKWFIYWVVAIIAGWLIPSVAPFVTDLINFLWRRSTLGESMIQRASDARRAWELLISIRVNCDAEPRLFANLLRLDEPWSVLALRANKKVSEEVVRQGLDVLNNRDLSAEGRIEMIIWLCKVQIKRR